MEKQIDFIAVSKQIGVLKSIESDFFDCCFLENTIYFWEDPVSHFKKMHDVLQPGGKASLAFIERKNGGHLPWTLIDFTFYDLHEVETFFRKGGFANIEVKQLTEERMGKDGKKRVTPFVIMSGTVCS